MMLVAVAVALVLGLLIGGRPENLSQIRFRWGMFLFVAVVVRYGTEAAIRYGVGPVEALRFPLYAVAFAAIAAILWANRAQPGLLVAAAGVTSNGLAIVLNGGWMPVWRPALELVGMTPADLAVSFHRLLPEQLGLEFLLRGGPFGDLVPVPLPVLTNVASIGDAFVAIGLGWYVFAVLISHPGPALPTAGPADAGGGAAAAAAQETLAAIRAGILVPSVPLRSRRFSAGPPKSRPELASGYRPRSGDPCCCGWSRQLGRVGAAAPINRASRPCGHPGVPSARPSGRRPTGVRHSCGPASVRSPCAGPTVLRAVGGADHQPARRSAQPGGTRCPGPLAYRIGPRCGPHLPGRDPAQSAVRPLRRRSGRPLGPEARDGRQRPDASRAGAAHPLGRPEMGGPRVPGGVRGDHRQHLLPARPHRGDPAHRACQADLTPANGAMATAETMADLAGYPLAGLFVAFLGTALTLAFWFDAASYLVSAALVLSITIPPVMRHGRPDRDRRPAQTLGRSK